MFDVPSSYRSDEETIINFREREDSARSLSAQHKEVWGEGPPYFSVATYGFWKELAAGKFYLARCSSCLHVYFPPRVVCSECWGQDCTELYETPGEGNLVTFTELFVTSPVLKPIAPLRIAIVDLDEGVRILTWLRGADAPDARPGQRCKISVEHVLDRNWFVANTI